MTDQIIFEEKKTKITVPVCDDSKWTLKIVAESVYEFDSVSFLQMTSIVEFRRIDDANKLVEYIQARAFLERKIFPDFLKHGVPYSILDTLRSSLHEFYKLDTYYQQIDNILK